MTLLCHFPSQKMCCDLSNLMIFFHCVFFLTVHLFVIFFHWKWQLFEIWCCGSVRKKIPLLVYSIQTVNILRNSRNWKSHFAHECPHLSLNHAISANNHYHFMNKVFWITDLISKSNNIVNRKWKHFFYWKHLFPEAVVRLCRSKHLTESCH